MFVSIMRRLMSSTRYIPLLLCILFVACGPRPAQKKGTRSDGGHNLERTTYQLASIARKYEGAKYKYGAEGPRAFDCSGFTRFVYAQVGVELPRRSADQAQFGKKISLEQVQSGDLLVLKKGRKVEHVGIVVDANDEALWVTHASTSRGVITEDMSSSPYWKPRIRYARRVLP
jgi:cell wall-associated NlpC family hydrolase